MNLNNKHKFINHFYQLQIVKNQVIFFILLTFISCKNGNKTTENKIAIINSSKISTEKESVDKRAKGIKVLNQADTNCVWKYYHPFTDKSYLVSIQNCPEEDGGRNNATICFEKKIGKTNQVFWRDSLFVKIQSDFLIYQDFNGDDIKDLVIFSETGGRGGNSFYYLYLIDLKNRKVNRVKNFESIVNPEYNIKHHVVVAYGLSGTNNYSIYKISKANEAYKIGESFEDTFESDTDELDKRIVKVLKKSVH